GFAVLTGSFVIGDDDVRFRSRQQPVQLPPAAETIAVFRIDAEQGAAVPADTVARRILAAVPRSVRGVQIDFDARVSERTEYRKLLVLLRRGLSANTELSITALASWCLDDPWIFDLPIDEAIPMLFQMGPEAAAIRRYLERGGAFRVPLCHRSVGLSLDEPVMRLPRNLRQIYLFSPQPWSQRSVALAQQAGMFR
ncbi:MAG: DUF3142 domain-containing protein, partial [Bryobacteraceae bacterium]|nr:DUF3142 domain-containing protein [Bryobacteraceae bacterium]